MEPSIVGWLIFLSVVTIGLLVLAYLSFSGKLSYSKLLKGSFDTGFSNENDKSHPNYQKACVYMGIMYLACSAAAFLLGLYCLTGEERLKISIAIIAGCMFALLIISVTLFRNKSNH